MRDEASAGTGYAANPLDRRADLRRDAAAVYALRDERARAVLFCNDKAVLKKTDAGLDAFFTLAEALALGSDTPVFLGIADGAHFGGLVPVAEDALKEAGHAVIDLRSLYVQGAVADPVMAVLGQAKSLLGWHANHPHCARCGARTAMSQAGWRRDCPSCGAQHFPRTDPVVIMLIHQGDHCLLARKPMFPPGMHSCLAGFVEPGETIEDAVRRETMEEAGITAGRVSYFASQPWPLPFGQLMIGCFAEATTGTITLETDELEAGRWYSREECRLILEGRHPEGVTCPPRAAIASLLIREWVKRDA